MIERAIIPQYLELSAQAIREVSNIKESLAFSYLFEQRQDVLGYFIESVRKADKNAVDAVTRLALDIERCGQIEKRLRDLETKILDATKAPIPGERP